MGKILRVDVGRRTFSVEEYPEEDMLLYVGGRGIGAKLLFDDFHFGADALSPANRLVFVTGPLTGTPLIYSGKWMVVTKSPLTGSYTRSVSGGLFGVALKRAGFDALIIEGASEKPIYLFIGGGKVEFRDASDYWGLTKAVQERIKGELNTKGLGIACIGPAGENLVRFAAIVSGNRTASRGGAGAVMGSKKVKAIAIIGHKTIPLPAKDSVIKVSEEQKKIVNEHPAFPEFREKGTAMLEWVYSNGFLPIKNFREATLPEIENLYSDSYAKMRIKHTSCFNCPLRCGKVYRVKDGDFAGVANEGPEYETMFALGSLVGNTDAALTVAADKLCDEYGLDTISTGGVISFSMELFERGIINHSDTEGCSLEWGNKRAIYELIRKIALREGFGNLLAEGTQIAAKTIGKGARKFAIQVKGLEVPGWDPRGAMALATNYATSNIGASHCIGFSPSEILGVPEPTEPFKMQKKGELAKMNQDLTAIYETGIVCLFPFLYGMVPVDLYGRMLSTATGIQEFEDSQHLLEIGERIWNLERLFNVREGFGRKHDTLPIRFEEEPLNEGRLKGRTVKLGQMLEDYYRSRGWDVESGIPPEEKLRQLKIYF